MTTSAPRVALEPAATTDAHPPFVEPAANWRIEPLWETGDRPGLGPLRGGPLPADVAARYGADLAIPLRTDGTTIVANFVSTLDGIVALDRLGASGGREISGGFEPDRFLMALLRATADAVLVGAGTVRASRTHGWAPRHAHPASASAFAEWRRALGLTAAGPATVFISASGELDVRHLPADPDLPVIVVTTAAGARHLRSLPRPDHVEVAPVADAARVPIDALLEFLDERGLGLVLSEGGPTILGELLTARKVDELFLTVAPQLAGRSENASRLGLVEGVGFSPDGAPWLRLRSAMRCTDHLFLRYQLPSQDRKDMS